MFPREATPIFGDAINLCLLGQSNLHGTPPPSHLRSAGLKPQVAVRKKEPAYREQVAGKQLSDAPLIELMAEYLELIQRPIVVRGKKAVLGGPVENLRELRIK